MKKKLLNSMRALLVAAGLCVGTTSAWAASGDVTTNVNLLFNGSATFEANKAYTYTKATGEVLSSATGWVWNDGGNPKQIGLVLNENGQLSMSNGNLTVEFDGSAAREKDVVTVEFDLAYPYVYNANNNRELQFTIYAGSTAVVDEKFNFNKNTIVSSTMGLTTEYIHLSTGATSWDNSVHFTFTFNYLTQKITMATACNTATNKSGEFEISMPNNTGAITKFYISMGSSAASASRFALLDNLVVKTTEGDYSTTKNITLTFEDEEGNDISNLYTGTTTFTPESGTTFSPSDYYPSYMYDGEYRYSYVGGGNDFEVTSDATVKLVYHKESRPSHTITIVKSYGGKTSESTFEVLEATNHTYYYPRFIKDGSTLYEYASSTDANASNSYWTSTLTNVTAPATYTLTYNALPGECVFYAEGESIDGAASWSFSNYISYMSGGASGAFTDGMTLTSLDAGVYTITVRAIGRANDRYVKIYRNTVADENQILSVTSGNKGSTASSEFTLTGTTTLVTNAGNAGGANGHACDFVYIMKTSSISATIPSSGFGTIASAYALDCSKLPKGVTAYKVTAVTSTAVKLAAVTEAVAAGTGLILNGTAGDYSIPVAATGATLSDNKLQGAVEATLLEDGSFYILQDGKFCKVSGATTEADRTMPAGKAYLLATDVPPASGARSLVFEFGDEATGISAVAREVNDGEYYNLQGQRVSAPKKGLYIVNGKKVVVK